MVLRSEILVNKNVLPTAEQALPGRETPMNLPETHFVNGNPLLAGDIPRLIVTPHNAWGSREARQRIVGQLSENAQAFFSGEALRVVS